MHDPEFGHFIFVNVFIKVGGTVGEIKGKVEHLVGNYKSWTVDRDN